MGLCLLENIYIFAGWKYLLLKIWCASPKYACKTRFLLLYIRINYSSSQRLIKYLPTSINSWCISSIVTGCNSFVLWIDYVNLRSKLSWISLQRQFKKLIVHEICSFLPRTCFNFRLNLGFKNFMQYVSTCSA